MQKVRGLHQSRIMTDLKCKWIVSEKITVMNLSIKVKMLYGDTQFYQNKPNRYNIINNIHKETKTLIPASEHTNIEFIIYRKSRILKQYYIIHITIPWVLEWPDL